jgi:hypothetical protein
MFLYILSFWFLSFNFFVLQEGPLGSASKVNVIISFPCEPKYFIQTVHVVHGASLCIWCITENQTNNNMLRLMAIWQIS